MAGLRLAFIIDAFDCKIIPDKGDVVTDATAQLFKEYLETSYGSLSLSIRGRKLS